MSDTMGLHFIERHITPKIEANSVKEKLTKAISFRDAGVIGQAIVELLKQYPDIQGLDFFENVFREMNCDTYLVAVPKANLPDNQIAFNFKTHLEAPYWVWICVNGKREYEATFKSFQIDGKENLSRLRETGFIMVKD